MDTRRITIGGLLDDVGAIRHDKIQKTQEELVYPG